MTEIQVVIIINEILGSRSFTKWFVLAQGYESNVLESSMPLSAKSSCFFGAKKAKATTKVPLYKPPINQLCIEKGHVNSFSQKGLHVLNSMRVQASHCDTII